MRNNQKGSQEGIRKGGERNGKKEKRWADEWRLKKNEHFSGNINRQLWYQIYSVTCAAQPELLIKSFLMTP